MDAMATRKRILIIAGPNGAGKTTYANAWLQKGGYRHFVNADLIAKGLSPFDPDAAAVQAGRLMLEKLDELAARGESFAFETTLSGLGYVRRIQEWKKQGYRITLVFLRLQDPEQSVERVAQRVSLGGHNIPPEVARRRFGKGLANFYEVYRNLVHDWALVDNSGENPVMIERSDRYEAQN